MKLSLFSLFGKKDSSTNNDFKPLSEQNGDTKTVTQIISGEAVEFSYEDFHNLKENSEYDRFFAGQISLPTGKVICTDPMYRELAIPQSWKIESGQYPVYLYLGLDDDSAGRILYAELIFKDEVPAFWELSLIAEELLKNPLEKKINGLYPVENGLSCFSDMETFKIYEEEIREFYQNNKDGDFYIDLLEKYFKDNANIPASSRGEDWANYKPVKAKANIIMFATGWGDGLYPRYIGFDRKGNIVKMITAFT